MSKEATSETKDIILKNMDPFLLKRIERAAAANGLSLARMSHFFVEQATRLLDKDTYKSAKKELEKILP